ncbi:MAG: hypothetical protein DME54_08225 [Verrucomicrobia bacterium]|nr:MAG: hypothetical protein DME62_04395 [Verrucomicrobiota bacterium]PYK34531.1 MAG: hypothetical protein DME54_08225 [Verrucomicrobiota bacterium]PYL21961.1 MAG: hypothetical protein DMF41_00540 [Verrucomicrobiota bacterium]
MWGCPLWIVDRTRLRPHQSAAIGLLLLFASALTSVGASWQSTLTKDPPGNFPELRPLRATYRFGWAGFTAATSEIHFTKSSENKFQLDGTGRTIGLVRALWKLDADYHAVADQETLRPIEARQTENYRSRKIATHLAFTSNGVTRTKTESQTGSPGTKARQFRFADLFDMHSAILYLRSQPLKNGDVYRLVVYPANNAYLAITTVISRDRISVQAGAYKAIKIDLQLKRIGKHLELEPHRKFRRATIWVSDDADRILLRIEAQIFVGTVWAELQSLQFDNPR